ncbi:5'/3'-nucleotidase SurE [Georgenia subflava]|uniref:5'-nucleotidase n=1 Tax=Georgenia subflava TaxID=1622177 RepID=A0A6N7EJY3_9MICO|nr:5'/3'-nucleotidase SurE [Georgenia subflava]MPV36865.1 5'/3'-nucleotidase SurE [Georgenia subflava]
MRVLVTNDDGIASPGLTILAEAALDAGYDVVVAAPHRQYSGASAALTAQEEDGQLVLVDERPPGLPAEVEAYGVKAAPGLIAFVASFGAFGDKPDVVMSGINLGANTGRATLHSGTVGAALSASSHGIRGMAVSIASGDPQHWQTARQVTDHALAWLVDQPLDERVLNVNVPDIAPDRLRGIRPATLASFGAVQARVKELGTGYVQLTYTGVEAEEEPGTDHYLLARGWATVTMLRAPVHDDSGLTMLRVDGADSAAESVAGEEQLVNVSTGTVMSSGADRPSGEIKDDDERSGPDGEAPV